MKNNAVKKIKANIDLPRSRINKTPTNIGINANGNISVVANGFAICRRFRPKTVISIPRIKIWWKCNRSGFDIGAPVYKRRKIASNVSAIGKKNMSRIAKGVISGAEYKIEIAIQTNI